MNPQRGLEELHTALGYKKLNRVWAKLEILLGLSAAGGGVLLRTGPPLGAEGFTFPIALVLFVLGGYLALAGHRSHLYQSSNERTAYLAELLRNKVASRVTSGE